MAQTPGSPTPAAESSSKQDLLIHYCRNRGLRAPSWQVLSDRRGGRTAWSCTVIVNGQHVPARYWYDGQYVNNAREDAAERALQMLGQLPAPNGPQPTHYHQQQRTTYGAGTVGS
ncbi:hypothetical protein BAUCODRAFT_240803 [Baudoinia panamericana UAMH 10762]|uniref:DRBM domain-containing protein n=1 Tax=Baudoinia panamericana (strain UAMH 10762) TaxID=717646 RepID=M2MPT6_BAUPA|nr:uncharacterized protein BAUCODRAFT_240803 [Baudoinia panamericana UAMH 10762]EMC93458.1 hypothetical protein BAUCODRAFT_240803 [Baudoinia panamericana UAMH 10762]